jgi:hypothetical protein
MCYQRHCESSRSDIVANTWQGTVYHPNVCRAVNDIHVLRFTEWIKLLEDYTLKIYDFFYYIQ